MPSPFAFLPPQDSPARKLAILLLVLAPLLFGFLALYLGQDANWDLRNYHYYNAYAFLNNRYDTDLLPAQTPSFYNPLMDVPFFWLASHAPARVAGFALGFVQGLNFLLLFALAHVTLVIPNARRKVFICAALAALGLLGGGGIAQIGTTFGDNITSLGMLLSAALVVRNLDHLRTQDAPKIFLKTLVFGIPAGLMVGLKLPSVLYAVGLCGGLLFTRASPWRNLALSFFFGLGVLLGAALTFGPWAYFLQTHFGSPVFPYFNGFFGSPLAPPTSARDTAFAPHSLSDIFLMPFLFAQSGFRVGEIAWRDWRIPLLYVALPLALAWRFFGRRKWTLQPRLTAPTPSRYLLASFALSYGVWLLMFSIYRYAVTLEMIAPLLLVCAIGLLPLGLRTRGIIAGLALLIVVWSIQPGNWHRRASWSKTFVTAEIPPVSDPAHAMILMTGMEPYAHLIPLFPPEISVTRIQSNFSSPEQDKGINTVIHVRIDAHRAAKGRFLLLIPAWQLGTSDGALAFFHLKRAPKPCETVTDHLFDDNLLKLCDLEGL